MAKKRRKNPERPKVARPPQGFWLSPKGAVVPVQVHAEALMFMPEAFGLDRAPHGRDEVNEAMREVIIRGWIRARMLSPGRLSFQAWSADRETIRAISEFLFENHLGVDSVAIETLDPQGFWDFSLEEFLERAWPQKWGLGAAEAGDA